MVIMSPLHRLINRLTKPLDELQYKGWAGDHVTIASPYTSPVYLGWAMASLIVLVVTGVLPIVSWFSTYRFSVSSALCVGIFAVVLVAFCGVSYMDVVSSRDAPQKADFLAALLPLVCFPALLSLCFGLLKWKDDNWKLSRGVRVFIAIGLLLLLSAISAVIAIVQPWTIGSAFLLVLVLVVLAIGVIHFWASNNFYLTRMQMLFVCFLAFLLALAAVVVGYFQDITFVGASVGYFTFLFPMAGRALTVSHCLVLKISIAAMDSVAPTLPPSKKRKRVLNPYEAYFKGPEYKKYLAVLKKQRAYVRFIYNTRIFRWTGEESDEKIVAKFNRALRTPEEQAAAKKFRDYMIQKHPSKKDEYAELRERMKVDSTFCRVIRKDANFDLAGFSYWVASRKENEFEYPLHVAARANNPEAMKLTLEFYNYVDIKDKEGRTALMYACTVGSMKCAKLLLDAGADINARDVIDCTPLMHAIVADHTNCVTLLLDSDADITCKNVAGFDALFFAKCYRRDVNIKNLLDDRMRQLGDRV